MNKKDFIQLLKKYRLGTATKEEKRFIEAYYDLFEVESGTEDLLEKEERERLKQEIRENIKKEKALPEGGKKVGIITLYIRGAAAAIVILVLLGSGFYLIQQQNSQSKEKETIVQKKIKEEIHPGGQKAVLTLGNGQKVKLDSNSQGKLTQQSFVKINIDSGSLVYDSEKDSNLKITYNTITTPYGGEYRITLSDGTKVWLNAGSSLHYPVKFNGNKRGVKLTGEGYFEVAQNEDHPFVVEAEGMEIKVLGTHFNVEAYPEENTVSTTLASGAIKVVKNSKTKLLAPGEQAVLNKREKKLVVKKVNVKQILAWKNAMFYFNNTNIQEIMKKISRWYNVKTKYEAQDLKNKNFSGVISRYKDVGALLKRMELTGTIDFKIEGKVITVKD